MLIIRSTQLIISSQFRVFIRDELNKKFPFQSHRSFDLFRVALITRIVYEHCARECKTTVKSRAICERPRKSTAKWNGGDKSGSESNGSSEAYLGFLRSVQRMKSMASAETPWKSSSGNVKVHWVMLTKVSCRSSAPKGLKPERRT